MVVWTFAWPIHSWTRRMSDVGDPDDLRAECVAEVVEAEWAERGSLQRCAMALRKRGAVEVAAGDAGEDDVVIVREELALAEAGENFGDPRVP
jgi:hypothetical protein